MPTTSTTYGADFSHQVQADGILGYINGGGYTARQTIHLGNALLGALRDEVNERLPEGVTWQPATSEFLLPCNNQGQPLVELPDPDAMAELFAAAWTSVEARFEEIERVALAEVDAELDVAERADADRAAYDTEGDEPLQFAEEDDNR